MLASYLKLYVAADKKHAAPFSACISCKFSELMKFVLPLPSNFIFIFGLFFSLCSEIIATNFRFRIDINYMIFFPAKSSHFMETAQNNKLDAIRALESSSQKSFQFEGEATGFQGFRGYGARLFKTIEKRIFLLLFFVYLFRST